MWGENGGALPCRQVEPIRFRRLERTEIIGLEVPVATTTISRLLGLSLLRRRRAGPGLLIPRCRSVHTFGMRFRLDLVFLDDERRVIEIRRNLPSRRIVRCAAADAVLELPAPMIRDGGEGSSEPA
jgi:uncharacterized membrane protein (UPF0127 family)